MNSEFPAGLSDQEAKARLAAEGPNELGGEPTRSLSRLAAEVLREPMFALLLAAGGIYLALGDAHEAMILLGFLVVVIAVTVLHQRRTEKALEALRDLSSPRALVVRGGAPARIAGRDVVRDDVLILSEGDRVSADGLVLHAHDLAADESMLTGESAAVAKFPGQAVLAGTMIVRGHGLARVTATGGRTELGRIGKSLHGVAVVSSPLRREIALLTRRLALVGGGLCIVLSVLYWALLGGWLDGILAGITLAMGILPQELPVILIVFLALGARRIATARVLTRRLEAIETLGEATVLCVDKTGTLTQNRMSVAALSVGGQLLELRDLGGELPERYHELVEYLVLASEIEPRDPMEQAFHQVAQEYLANTEHLHPDWILAREYEISPDLLAMSHLWRSGADKDEVAATKGAPEAVAGLCHLGEAERRQVSAEAERMAHRGLRVLGVAKATVAAREHPPEIQHDFDCRFVGLVGLADPLRPGVRAAVAECRQAGIRVVMITGDHPRTAAAIAAAAGIDSRTVLTGDRLAEVDEASLQALVRQVNVFARVTPHQKLALVEALKRGGDVVAMTGDGVNDAPALKAAHIGIAMGKRGTDVAREAASLVLLEDDFSAIVAAIRLGRRIFANLRQALVYTLAVHVPIIGLSVLPILLGQPLILAPIHIAFFELVIDPACSVVFEAEEGAPDLMARPPRSPSERLLAPGDVALSLVQGGAACVAVAVLYAQCLVGGTVEEARALAFVALVAANCALIVSSRSSAPAWRRLTGFPRVGAVVIAATLTVSAVVTFQPDIAKAFAFQPPRFHDWLNALLVGAGMLLFFESSKAVRRRT